MRLIPVIDLKGGQVVRAVAGRRAEYQAIQSVLCTDAHPNRVAQALAGLQPACVYVADLDAIGGAEPAWAAYDSLAACGLQLWIDAGIRSLEHARRLADFCPGGRRLAGVVAGLETLPAPDLLSAVLQVVGPQRLIFSLDLKDGEPLAGTTSWRAQSAAQLADVAISAGLERIIVLDLAQVGTDRGLVTLELCRWLRQIAPHLEITTGGGIRGPEDLVQAAAAGCDAVLIASALHDGRITPEEFRRWD